MAYPLRYGQPAQPGGEEPGGEGVARPDGGDDGDGGRGLVHHEVRAVRAVRSVLDRAGEDGGAVGALLHHEHLRFGQQAADRLQAAARAPQHLGLVRADEDEVLARARARSTGPAVAASGHRFIR